MATQTLDGRQKLAFIVMVAMISNYASVKFYAYPFLYCWLSPVLIPIWEPMAGVLHLFAMLALVMYLVCRRFMEAALAGGAIVAIIGIPQWTNVLFRMGASCGGA